MRTFIKAGAVSIIALGAFVVPATAANAAANPTPAAAVTLIATPVAASPTNLGQCESQTLYHSQQAPGQSATGPLVVSANGVLHTAPPFAGAQGCNKS